MHVQDGRYAHKFKHLLESGSLRPVFDRSYPLAEIVEVYRYSETGNVVITVEQD